MPIWRCLPLSVSLRPVSCLVTDARHRHRHLPLNTWSHHTPASLTSHGGPVGTKPTIHLPWITSPMASAGFLSVGRRPAARSDDCLAGALPLPRAMGAPVESRVCRRSQSALPSQLPLLWLRRRWSQRVPPRLLGKFPTDISFRAALLAIPTVHVLSCTTMTFLSKPTFLWSKPTLSLAHNYFLVKTYFISLANS